MSKPLKPWLRWTCIAALGLGLVGLAVDYQLTQHIHATAPIHPDPAHGLIYEIQDYWYVTMAVGLTRNILLLVSGFVTAVSAAILFRREIWFYLWTQYLTDKPK